MACLFGHKWNGCKCEKCGKTRDQDHRFQAGDHPCVQVCAVCGAEKTEHGAYVNGFCEKCGSASRFPLDCSALTAEAITANTDSMHIRSEATVGSVYFCPIICSVYAAPQDSMPA